MSIDDELLEDAQHDAEAVDYIRKHLPQELQERLDDDLLYYFLDLTVEYLAESNILDAEPDKDGYVDIDVEAIAQHLAKKAQKEGMGQFETDDLQVLVMVQTSDGRDVEEGHKIRPGKVVSRSMQFSM